MNDILDIKNTPLEAIDVSRPELFKNDTWQPWFERLRAEAPVHYLSDSANRSPKKANAPANERFIHFMISGLVIT